MTSEDFGPSGHRSAPPQESGYSAVAPDPSGEPGDGQRPRPTDTTMPRGAAPGPDGESAGAADPQGTGLSTAQDADRTGLSAAQDADRTGGQATRRRTFRRRLSAWQELPILIVVALAIALLIKNFVVQPFFIPTSSMEDTLMVGDKVLVNKLVYDFRPIEAGDIVVFNGDGSWNPIPPPAKSSSNPFAHAYDVTLKPLFSAIAGLIGTPADQTDYIKRVIGVPGDHVVCCNSQGLVTVNGVPLHEQSYLYPGAAPSRTPFNIVVPPGRLWVMGDNRAISDDSRMRRTDPGNGTIPESSVIGRAFLIIWPPSHWRVLPIPSTFDQPGIDKPRVGAIAWASAGAAAPAAGTQQAALDRLLGTPVRPEVPYLPLAAGVVGAVPLTWLQRRARRRLASRLRQRRLSRRG